MLLLMLVAAIACSSVAIYMRVVRIRNSTRIEWVPYSAATIADCKKAGIPVAVVYEVPLSTTDRDSAESPFDDPETARLLNKMDFVVMNADLNFPPENTSLADRIAMRRDVKALNGGMPLIVIYDTRLGGAVIPAKYENGNERQERIGKILREYCARLERER